MGLYIYNITWGGTLAATSRSFARASGPLKRTKNSSGISLSMAMAVGALFLSKQVLYFIIYLLLFLLLMSPSSSGIELYYY